MKNIAILGSTGSIGRNTLEVIKRLGSDFKVHSISACRKIDLLAEQAREFRPRRVAVTDSSRRNDLQRILKLQSEDIAFPLSVELLYGEDALVKLATDPDVDVVVNALVGGIGLQATLVALDAGKTVALANKESIVMAGRLVMETVENTDGLLIPIDSEHSAVLQCLRGENPENIRRLILTASGGPFLHRPLDHFADISPEEALKHPNWNMGPKITIDSATLMNKGMEVIEAKYLFNLPPEKIDVVIHPQSIIHSMVEFTDGSIKAQLSSPDMKIPIQYALTYPDRKPSEYVQTDFLEIGTLTFEKPNLKMFPCLQLAFKALEAGDGYSTVLSAANEIAVEAFLACKLPFDKIPEVIEKAFEAFQPPASFDLESILKIDKWVRGFCQEILDNNYNN